MTHNEMVNRMAHSELLEWFALKRIEWKAKQPPDSLDERARKFQK